MFKIVNGDGKAILWVDHDSDLRVVWDEEEGGTETMPLYGALEVAAGL